MSNNKSPSFTSLILPLARQKSFVATKALLFVIVAIFVAMCVVSSGEAILNPSPELLVSWGADYGPLSLNGEWWRALTAMFLHIGILHMMCNAWYLWVVGGAVEKVYGTGRFLVIYFLSGLAGSTTSLLFTPDLCSVGASGALFGVCGAALVFLHQHKNSIDSAVYTKAFNGTVMGIIAWLIIGRFANFDNGAHAGGLISGLILGALLMPDSTKLTKQLAAIGSAVFALLVLAEFMWATTIPIDMNNSYWSLRGIYLGAEGKYKESAEALDRQLELTPDEPQTLAYRAIYATQQGDFETAAKCAAKVKSEEAWVVFAAAQALAQVGNYDKAILLLDEFLATSRQSESTKQDRLSVLDVRARICMLENNYDEAFKTIAEALKIDYEFVPAIMLKAQALEAEGKQNEAIKEVEKTASIRVEPQDMQWHLNRAYTRYQLGDYKGCIEDCKSVTNDRNIHSAYGAILKYLALREIGDKDAATALAVDAEIVNRSWPYAVIEYFMNSINQDELLKLDSNDKLTEAKTFIGIDLLQNNDQKGREMLEWVQKNGNKFFLEYNLAKTVLKNSTPE